MGSVPLAEGRDPGLEPARPIPAPSRSERFSFEWLARAEFGEIAADGVFISPRPVEHNAMGFLPFAEPETVWR
jgi:hypothetical protein